MAFSTKEKRNAYDIAYQKQNIKRIPFSLNRTTDADILTWLDGQDNKQGAIKELIREHLKTESVK